MNNQPPKGTYDWLPEEFAVRKYIFDVWRQVCQRFGYQEYLTPLVEYADLYRAKSGEDVGGPELTVFEDRGGRELAIRPEMTPSVTRLVSQIYNAYPKPIRFFSIANFYRNEKPQRGRNREFWQLNFDIFGSDSFLSDLEILQMALEIMLAFGPPKKSFTLRINNRKLVNEILSDVSADILPQVFRILDKFEKLPRPEIETRLQESGLNNEVVQRLLNFVSLKSLKDLNSPAANETKRLIETLEKLGYGEWIEFSPLVLRGFDYYDGIVFEVFDNNPLNTRSMFGGGRYNGLAGIFGQEPFPAVGSAPGDETTRLFLEGWNILPKIKSTPTQVLVTIFSPELADKSLEISQNLRSSGINVELYPETEIKLDKQLKYADKKQIPYVVIIGPEEIENKVVVLKNLETKEQKKVTMNELCQLLA